MDRLPLIVQSDRTLLLEVDNALFEEARDSLVGFAELVKSPEHVHTYRVSSLSLWNAVASGMTTATILDRLTRFSQYPVPQEVITFIEDQGRRYGKLRLEISPDGHGLWLTSDDSHLLTQLTHQKAVQPYLGEALHPGYRIDPSHRGLLKQALAKIGWPADDRAGYSPGLPLTIALREREPNGQPFTLRHYQQDAIRAFWGDGGIDRGSGVVVLPCGAGKTMVGIGAMEKVQAHTLILTTSVASLHQWRDELLHKTTLTPEEIGEYSARTKVIRPVTLTTYQILSHRQKGEFVHFAALDDHDWGLIIYDEVHLLPAPVFRLTASLQARRRLGLTATLIREDGRADDVFSLIGPKRFDMPWKDLEAQGWIAEAACREIRVRLPESWRERYAMAEDQDRARIAASNPAKVGALHTLLAEHQDDHILIIGQYLDQLEAIHQEIGAPLITGQTPTAVREELYQKFRSGEVPVLIVSKVANFSIDLPDANVAIQVSGAFGSRQEEAQRLGRILRPKKDGGMATFYSLVTEDTKEQDFAQKRQLFLCEQGYRYDIAHADDTGAPAKTNQAPVIPFPGGLRS
ncbi:DNA repair helicase XPB [Sulfobacillus sp. hq2]|uniref:DNA repair helicase XPB n=1 Tax=Sulfobacillus sp. hq2 TaxID=2039167 RepID=UPI000CD125AB|nr:DNA repair helicase XPB [Sulfobacillus sp. hq2]POB10386.1 helicase [Sulfobacillus sp. hq2]